MPAKALPISEQVVHECLLSQPQMQLAASQLAKLFDPKSDAERLSLTRCISRVADIIPGIHGKEPLVRLRAVKERESSSSSHRSSINERQSSSSHRGSPLPLEPIAVKALLLAQPQQEMAAAELSARFAPRSEEERMSLVELISQIGDLVTGADGQPVVRLRPSEQRPPMRSRQQSDAGGISSEAEQGQPITPVERELVRKVLCSCPDGTMRADELVRMLAPTDPAAKRRLARVVVQVARAVEKPDGRGGKAAFLVLRDENSGGINGSGSSSGSIHGPSATYNADGRRRHPTRHCPSTLTDASRATTTGASQMSRSSASAYWGASGVSSCSIAEHPPPAAQSALSVSEDNVIGLLRAKGGRMPSNVLISKFQPLDPSGKRRLASIVQRVCKTLLPASGTATDGTAVVVLREALLLESVELRAATRIQRAQRQRQEELYATMSAAIAIQCAARRRLAFQEACYRWEARRAVSIIQDHGRRLVYRAQLRRARMELRGALVLQMGARRWALQKRVARRLGERHDAAVRVQSARRQQIAKHACAMLAREAMMASETPEERAAREGRERTALLRDRLRRRKRLEERQQQQQQQPMQPVGEMQRISSPQQVAVQQEQRTHSEWGAAATVAEPQPEATEEVAHDVEEEPADIGSLLSRLSAQAAGGDGLVLTAPGSAEEAVVGDMEFAGGDFLAEMRAMMAAHGGDDETFSDEDDAQHLLAPEAPALTSFLSDHL